ncbi:hypothetical protein [Bradyrhizobium japonicum]|uniref:hypothetical protein n=1 Tax=Bradyrhizobium japonicum TaxID=375 RepID=UPI001BAB230F|nr:hypothetical protein [Bradyrhizobium japonicum]MBR0911592.1 hypothetical protein [Bradyrhizobium japonicum]
MDGPESNRITAEDDAQGASSHFGFPNIGIRLIQEALTILPIAASACWPIAIALRGDGNARRGAAIQRLTQSHPTKS